MTEIARSAFRAMGTEVKCLAPASSVAYRSAAREVQATFQREEHRFSRFLGSSELTRVNDAAGSWVEVSPPFAEVMRLALKAWRETSGRFDPTLLGAIVSAGYDRDFDEILAGARVALRPGVHVGRADEVGLEGRRLRLPEGVGLDLGGIVKGWTVDRAADAAIACGVPWALIEAGGDLRVAGSTPAGGLQIAVEDPESPGQDIGRIAMTCGALATSSVTKRAWGLGANHLIDPVTGAPTTGPVLQATVWAPTCAEAEVRAKDALLQGRSSVERAPVLLALRDGTIITSLTTEERAA